MLVGDLIYNDDFDCNCNVDIYDCTEENAQWGEGGKKIYSTNSDHHKPLDAILDMKIKYITVDIKTCSIVVEATR